MQRIMALSLSQEQNKKKKKKKESNAEGKARNIGVSFPIGKGESSVIAEDTAM